MTRLRPVCTGLVLAIWAVPLHAQQVLYAIGDGRSDQSSELYTIALSGSQPEATVVGEVGLVLHDIAVDPTSHRIYAVDGAGPSQGGTVLYELNPQTAQPLAIGVLERPDQTVLSNKNALEFDVAGKLWVWGTGVNTELARIDPTSGAVLEEHDTTFPATGDLAFSVDGHLYGTIASWLVTLDAPFGGQNQLLINLQQSGFHGLEMDAAGTLYALKDASHYPSRASLWRIDLVSQTASEIGPIVGATDLGARGLAFRESKGVVKYGLGDGIQGLSLEYLAGPGDPRVGDLFAEGFGVSPTGLAVLGWSLLPTSIPLGSASLLIHPQFLEVALLYPDGAGVARLPVFLGSSPAPQPLFLQVFEVRAGLLSVSPGLAVR
jgi:hypothetical protein